MNAKLELDPTARGKVRDIYDLGDRLLMVATDRISAFDVVLPDPIPHKGEVLTKLSLYWFELLAGIVPNHLISADVADLPDEFAAHADYLAGRFMIVSKARVFPIECIVRGYLAGCGWAEYRRVGNGVRHAAPGRSQEASPSAAADVHAVDQGGDRHPRREHLGEADVRDRRRRVRRAARRRRPSRSTRRRETTPPRAASSSPTPSSSSGSSKARSRSSTRC